MCAPIRHSRSCTQARHQYSLTASPQQTVACAPTPVSTKRISENTTSSSLLGTNWLYPQTQSAGPHSHHRGPNSHHRGKPPDSIRYQNPTSFWPNKRVAAIPKNRTRGDRKLVPPRRETVPKSGPKSGPKMLPRIWHPYLIYKRGTGIWFQKRYRFSVLKTRPNIGSVERICRATDV